MLDHMIMSGKREPSKQDLTKQLAANWNVLSRKDKKVSIIPRCSYIIEKDVCCVVISTSVFTVFIRIKIC